MILKPYFTKSYKMMFKDTHIRDGLTRAFNIQNMSEYTPGRQFVASMDGNLSYFGVNTSVPIFHFCDNAIDTLLWYWEVFDFMDEEYPVVNFFEIKPLAKVYKNRSPDELMLYQCGTNKIEIVRHTSLTEVATDAMREIENGFINIILKYPLFDMLEYKERIAKQAQR